MKTRHPHALLALASALTLSACGPSTPVGNNVVEATSTTDAPASTSPAKAASPKPVARPVGPGDFALKVKILSQDCFGSGRVAPE